jgi:hypothetical protein
MAVHHQLTRSSHRLMGMPRNRRFLKNATLEWPAFAREPDTYDPWTCPKCNRSMLFVPTMSARFCLRRQCGEASTKRLKETIGADIIITNPPFRFRIPDWRHAEDQLVLQLRLWGYWDTFKPAPNHLVDADGLRAVGEAKRQLLTKVSPKAIWALSSYAAKHRKQAFLASVGPVSKPVQQLTTELGVALLRFDLSGRYAVGNAVLHRVLRELSRPHSQATEAMWTRRGLALQPSTG